MRVGDEIGGRFRLERKAGAGGMGVVYCARDLRDDRPVAIKCVVGSPLELERFAHEAAVLAEVEHPRLVRYIDHGVAGEARYLAMEWLEGEDLAHRLARGRLDPPDAVQVARGVAEVLAALHARGIVHRDVKPSNVYLEGGRCDGVKLLDLGVARDLERAWNLTGTGMAIGTPAYMAPEQARGEPVDARADLFSLGCLVFECLAGRPPFHADHPLAALAKMLLEDAPRLADLGIAAPPALEELLAALLSREREARPADAAAVLAALDAWSRPALLAPPAPAAAISSAEQRIVSVVLTRPATAAGDTMLPQESGDLERRVRAAAAASQARLERLPGGSYLAHFAGAGVPTDHAARGASFALALAALLGTDTIALATGRGQLGGRTPTGAVIDRAVALSGGGGAGVQLDPLSAALLEDRFEILGDGERRQLLGERDVRVPRRTLLGRVTACVGRERELAALSAALATCIEEPVASAILITAPPGAGKSRLVDEFVRSARARPDVARVALGGCDVMSAGSAFGALSRALRQALREDGDEGPLGRLAARLRGRMSADAAARSAELLGELCGLVRDDQASADLRRLRSDPVLLSDAIAEAFRALVAAETDAGALVLVLEDLHWGDLPSLRLIDSALRVLADRPLCVVATARPELHEQFPRLWAERGVQEIRLGALTRRPAERLARQVLGPGASDATIAQLVERAGGHPFLLEEMLRAAAAGHADELPDTVLGVVQARFDGLPEDARAALRAASVFGATFWLGGVAALLGAAPPAAPTPTPTPRDDPTPGDASVVTLVGLPTAHGEQTAHEPRATPRGEAPHVGTLRPRAPARGRLAPVDAAAAVLARLVAAEFIEPRADSKLAGQREYTFRHALVRDAAYATLVDADRVTGHRLAGAWLEAAAEHDALALAEHFERGGEPVRAARWYQRAAEDALEGNDFAAALRLAEHALARGPDDAIAGAALLTLADAHYWRGDMLAAHTAAAQAAACFAEGSDAWYTALAARIQSAGQRGDNDEVEACLVRALADDGRASDARLLCLARGACQLSYVSYSRVATYRPRIEALAAAADPGPLARGWLERVRVETIPNYRLLSESAIGFGRARADFEAAGALRNAGLVRIFQCRALSHTGDPAAALVELDQVAADIDRLGVPYLQFFAALERAVAYFYLGQDDTALAALARYEEFARGSKRIHAVMELYRAQIAFDRGDFAATLGHVAAICDSELAPSLRAPAFGARARALLRLGRADEALAAAEAALALARLAQPDVFDEVATIGIVEVLLAAGHRERARALTAARWTTLRSLPLGDAARARIVRRRVIRDLAALARDFGLDAPDPVHYA